MKSFFPVQTCEFVVHCALWDLFSRSLLGALLTAGCFLFISLQNLSWIRTITQANNISNLPKYKEEEKYKFKFFSECWILWELSLSFLKDYLAWIWLLGDILLVFLFVSRIICAYSDYCNTFTMALWPYFQMWMIFQNIKCPFSSTFIRGDLFFDQEKLKTFWPLLKFENVPWPVPASACFSNN